MGLKLNATNGGGSVELDVPDTVSSDVVLTLPATDGDADQFLQTNGSGALSFADPLGSAAAVSGTNFQFNSGFGSVATAYGCRAWVRFNGLGTVSIFGSGNVSSITDDGTGAYVVNLTTAMPDTSYAIINGVWDDALTPTGAVICRVLIATSSAINVRTQNADGTLKDNSSIGIAIFR